MTFSFSNAQVKTRTLKKVAELQMPQDEEDDMPGTRGAPVVWHPVQKKYYAVMAGNKEYPIAVFDATGKQLSDDYDKALIDVRGLWYNPVEKRIEGNAYGENGWFYYKLDEKGLVYEHVILFEGINQPTEQCVGAYNSTSKKVLFLKGSQVYDYESKTGTAAGTELILHWGRTSKQGASDDEEPTESSENHNTTTIVFTGTAAGEIGALNITDRKIELYNIKNGFLTETLKLPEDATTESMFNFAYTNGIYWLFDMEARKWRGYK